MEPLYINKEVQVFKGAEAQKRLLDHNDQRFMTDSGVIKVDQARWLEAQAYERRTWLELNSDAFSDHNEKNALDLGLYSYLDNRWFNRVIELGCGPFTNLRLILPRIRTVEVSLLDPLINDYISMRHCSYKDGFLSGYSVECIASSVEDFKCGEGKYDLVVMINVLPHCRDAQIIFEKIWDMMVLGGILVFREPCFKSDAFSNLFDAGHPLLVREDFLLKFMHRFKLIFQQRVFTSKEDVVDNYLCFSGIKE